jgi:LPS-assembly lipoprotein
MLTRGARQSLVTVLLIAALAGCGFQLRGTIDIPPEWLDLHLQSPSPNGELAQSVQSGFAANGVRWQQPAEANYTLQLGPEQMARRNLSVDRNARAAEFELTLSTTLQVTDSAGELLLPQEEVSVYTIMTYDPENVTGKVEEERLLRREMRTELVQRLMRKVRFLATRTPVAAQPAG